MMSTGSTIDSSKNCTRIKSLIDRMHSASSYSVQLYRPQPIPAVVAHRGSVATSHTPHTPEILSPTLKTESACVCTGIAMSPNGTTIDPHIDGAISGNMKPAASIPRSLAGTTIDNDIRGVTIKSGMHPPVQRMNSSTIYNAHSWGLRAVAAPVPHHSRSIASCRLTDTAGMVALKPASRSGSARKSWNDCGGTWIGCFNRQRLRDEVDAQVRARRFGRWLGLAQHWRQPRHGVDAWRCDDGFGNAYSAAEFSLLSTAQSNRPEKAGASPPAREQREQLGWRPNRKRTH